MPFLSITWSTKVTKNMSTTLFATYGLLFASLCSMSAHATTLPSDQQNIPQSAHQHGVATANLVWQSPQLMIELMLPAHDLLGFEHQANTAEQQQRIEKTQQWLQDATKVFVIADAQCTASSIELGGLNHLQSNATSDDKHQHDHSHDHKHDHKHDHDAEHSDHASHTDISATYLLDCNTTPGDIRFSLFKQYPAISRLNLTAIINGQQQAVVLTQDTTQFDLSD